MNARIRLPAASVIYSEINRYVTERLGEIHEAMESPNTDIAMLRGQAAELRQLLAHIKQNQE